MERLLTLFNQFSQLVKEAFDDDPRFLTARDKAYKHVVNDTSVFRLDLPTRLVIPFTLFETRKRIGFVNSLGRIVKLNSASKFPCID